MTKIAFIGLGIMGSPMAVHLANAGHDVVGYNPLGVQSTAVGRRRRPSGRLGRRGRGHRGDGPRLTRRP